MMIRRILLILLTNFWSDSVFFLLFLYDFYRSFHSIVFLESGDAICSNFFSASFNPVLFLAFEETFDISFVVIFFDIHLVLITKFYGIFLRLCNFLIHLSFLLVEVFLYRVDNALKLII